MKRILTIATVLVVSVAAMTAHDKKECHNDWKERVKSERIAFLTSEMSLTPEEAQVFWPVYNSVYERRDKHAHKIMHCYRELDEAVRNKRNVEEKLEAYVNALNESKALDESAYGQFRRVLPTEKVARLYLAEEKFRRTQIHRLRN